jgi:surface protein
MEENFDNYDLENLIIKDKEYYKKRKKKCLLIWIPIIMVIVIAIILVIVLKSKPDNKIICKYKINEKIENFILININNDIDYDLIINGNNYGKQNHFDFKEASIYEVIFDFEYKLNSLEGFFEGNKNLIDVDFSKLKTDNITSMANLLKSCSSFTKVFINNKTPNLKNVSNMFYNCNSLDTVYLNFETEKVTQMDFMFYNCSKLSSLDISNHSLENVINTVPMFKDCNCL